jgi:SAM-dependent methyltransferase
VGETRDCGQGGLAEAGAEKPGRHRADATMATVTPIWPVEADELDGRSGRGDLNGHHAHGDRAAPLFTKAAFDYATQRPGQPLALLQAGCTTADGDLDLGLIRSCVHGAAFSLFDDDTPAARTAVAAHPELAACTLSDLRMAPLVPRSVDIVHCTLLLQRIGHAELVLDRLVEALKPGGLLLLTTGDRDCAVGFLDRALPRPLRALIWRSLRPGEPGPYPAVYERLASQRGIQSYVLWRGLVIAQRQAHSLLSGRRRPLWLLAASRLVAALSRGRLTSAHDELRYVIRKPQSGFARVL